MEALATTVGNPKALAAMRRRHLERFTELEAERDTINAELDTLATQHPQQTSPELLSALPLIPPSSPTCPSNSATSCTRPPAGRWAGVARRITCNP